MIKYILFDLDGTLLRTDMAAFKKRFFELLAESELIKKLGGMGVFLDAFKAIHHGDGTKTNEQLFVESVEKATGLSEPTFRAELDSFYENDFQSMRTVFEKPDEKLRKAVDMLKEKGYALVLATGPVFPEKAMEMRLEFAGFSAKEFAFLTSWENSGYYKYDTFYYFDITKKLGAEPGECLMVGNSVREDLTAMKAGMSCFYMTGCQIGGFNDECMSGSPADFLEYVRQMPKIS